MTDHTFVYATYIRTTPEKLWEALTDPEFTSRYWNGRVVESDWREGSTLTVRHDYDDEVDFTATIVAAQPPRRLSYRGMGSPDSVVTFEITPHGEVTMLEVTHTGLNDEAYRATSGGWSFILSNLKSLLESGETLPMPDKVLAAYR